MKILLVGDCHSNTNWVEHHVLRIADELEVDQVFQVGDFGFRPEKPWGKEFLAMLKVEMPSKNYNFCWIDGNHENFDWLQEIGAFNASWPTDINTRFTAKGDQKGQVIYVPRGFVWEWGGKKFGSLGGAYSPDKSKRSPHVDYWPQETIQDWQVKQFIEGIKINDDYLDVLLTHDCPAGIHIAGENDGWAREFPATYVNRRRIKTIVDYAMPKLIVHGHYHTRYHTEVGPADAPIRVEGLNCDDNRNGMALLDTDKGLTLEDV